MPPGPGFHHELIPHPQHGLLGGGVSVHVADTIDTLRLCYTVSNQSLCLPAPIEPLAEARADGLWLHTCAELFVGVPGNPAYREFNFSPSGHWAAYDFSDYRQRLSELPRIPSPRSELLIDGEAIMLSIELERAALPINPCGRWECALSAVREATDGQITYWALAHPQPVPDFHHRAGFSLLLDALS